jgi:hypothetical protein
MTRTETHLQPPDRLGRQGDTRPGPALRSLGVGHGLGAIEQGDKVAPGLDFRSWPDAAAFDPLDGEPALTVIPNLAVTGALAVVISMALGVWTVWGVRHPDGGLAWWGCRWCFCSAAASDRQPSVS